MKLHTHFFVLFFLLFIKGNTFAEQQVQKHLPSSEMFPCSDCHDEEMGVDITRRDLTEDHEEISKTFQHGTRIGWCFDCHNPKNRDVLQLVDGTEVKFTESFKVCGQCHGEKLKDWNNGIHGKRTGLWNGQKTYYLCVHCHVPHSPKFKKLPPKPPPLKPAMFKIHK